jgi:hypothetical protein
VRPAAPPNGAIVFTALHATRGRVSGARERPTPAIDRAAASAVNGALIERGINIKRAGTSAGMVLNRSNAMGISCTPKRALHAS